VQTLIKKSFQQFFIAASPFSNDLLALGPASVAAFLAKVVTCKVILDVNLSFPHAIEELA